MFKRIAAGITAAVVFASFYGQGLVSEAFEDKGGYWDTGLQGYRFSLVNADGDVEKTVDVWDYSENREWATLGGSVEGALFNSADEYYVFNKCKLEIVKNDLYSGDDYETEICVDSSKKWYCADYREIFLHSQLKNYFHDSYKMIDYSGNQIYLCRYYNFKFSTGGMECNAGLSFVDRALTGNNRKDIEDFQALDDTWLGMCDILCALGVDVYEDVTDFSSSDCKRKIYNNLLKYFVAEEYCVVVEPIYAIPIRFYVKAKDKKTGEDVDVEDHVSLYYGSATEFAIINDERVSADNCGYSYYQNGAQNPNRLLMYPVTMGLAPKTMFVTDEYKSELFRYSGGKLKCINETDWDYEFWEGDLPESVKERAAIDPSYNIKIGEFGKKSKYEYNSFVKASIYKTDFITEYACAMAMITSSDFIKPQVATQDYDYHTSTDVISSVQVSNRSSTEYTTDISAESFTPETIKNGAGVPQAMVCKFSLISVLDESGTIPVFTTDLEISEQAEKKFAELGFAKDENGEYICEFYGSLDGLASKDEVLDNGYGASYISFEWKTPEKPCTVTFRAEFLDANLSPEAVLGTAEKDGKRATEVKSDDGRFTTEFECRINDDIEKNILNEDTVPPDSVSIISVKPAESASAGEWERYKTNLDIYNDYTDKFGSDANRFTEADYMGMTSESSLSWTEYTAAYRAGTADIEITAVNHTVTAAVTNDESAAEPDGTAKVIRTDASGLYEPYSDSIGSGYGIGVNFISSLTADTTGNSYERDLTVNGRSYKNTLVTNYGRGAVLFPEYDYEKYYGEVICTDDSDPFAAEYSLISNENSLYYEEPSESEDKLAAEIAQDKRSRIHFTPVWYPDGEYEIALCMFDAWTPAGELRLCRTASVTISGSLYDTWYVTRTANNQKRG